MVFSVVLAQVAGVVNESEEGLVDRGLDQLQRYLKALTAQ